jgi:hypothetical protein
VIQQVGTFFSASGCVPRDCRQRQLHTFLPDFLGYSLKAILQKLPSIARSIAGGRPIRDYRR